MHISLWAGGALGAASILVAALVRMRQPVWRLQLISPSEGLYKLTNVGRRRATNVRLEFRGPLPKVIRRAGPWPAIEAGHSVVFAAINAHGLPEARIGIRATETAALTKYRTHPIRPRQSVST